MKDQIDASTLYWTPTTRRTGLYTDSAWTVFEDDEICLRLSSLTADALYDVFLYDNSGTRTLELQIWAGHGLDIENASNATPIGVTVTRHPFQNGDEVYIEGVLDDLVDTNPYLSPHDADGTWIVANRATNTFELTGSAGSSDWLRGGYVSGRLAAGLLTTQGGILVKTGAPTRRYVGTIRTTGTTTTEDSRAQRFVWNAYNQVERALYRSDGFAHTIQNVPAGPTGYRLWDSGTDSRVAWIQGRAGQPVKLAIQGGVGFAASGAHVAFRLGLDGTPLADYITTASNIPAANAFQVSTTPVALAVQPGYHFADIWECEVGNVQTTVEQGQTSGTVWA